MSKNMIFQIEIKKIFMTLFLSTSVHAMQSTVKLSYLKAPDNSFVELELDLAMQSGTINSMLSDLAVLDNQETRFNQIIPLALEKEILILAIEYLKCDDNSAKLKLLELSHKNLVKFLLPHNI